jgi:single-stranded-DNA-specific exonuclease
MYNRGINTPREQREWLEASWDDMYDWLDLDDMNKMQEACHALAKVINNNGRVQVLTDCDCDGYTSAAIIMNYLYSRKPEWSEKYLSYILHDGKQHGLSDVMDKIDCDLLIVPDAASNDWQQQMELTLHRNIQVIILDHHDINDVETVDTTPAIVINVQNSAYPNKALTGAGVAYRFISAFEDLIIHGNQPTEFMDLCALGNCGDMADYRELEIRAIINEGFANIKNPFLYELCQKHKFTLDKRNGINYLSMAFAAVPFINAMTRSGTPEEQDIVFKGMLTQYAFEKVESSKRGEKGVYVFRYQEAVTTAERVKRRQDKLTQETVELLERRIQEQHLTDNAILLLLCEPDEVEANIAGLVANKLQAKYQHPTLVLRRTKTKNDKEYFYRGSGRNYSYCSIKDMRQLCESTELVEYASGHPSAFGCSIPEKNVAAFIQKTNELYKDVDFTPAYMVDFIWTPSQLNPQTIIEIAELDIWGQEMPQATVVVKDIPLSESNVQILGLAKGHPTIKIECNEVEFMLFKASEELYEQFIQPNQYLTIVGTCSKNEWNGVVKPQILIDDYDLQEKWIF